MSGCIHIFTLCSLLLQWTPRAAVLKIAGGNTANIALTQTSNLSSISEGGERLSPGIILLKSSEKRPRDFAFCAPVENGDMPWLRLLLRAGGFNAWNKANEDYVIRGASLMQVHDAPIPEGALKAAIVRDPVTRLLAGFLHGCRDGGMFPKCESQGPVLFGEAVAALETGGLDGADAIFMAQASLCQIPAADFDLVGHYEYFASDSQAIMQKAGLWEEYGPSKWGLFENAAFGDLFHPDNIEDKVCDFYTPELLQRVGKLYAEDFLAFHYNSKYWSSKCADAWSKPLVRSIALLSSSDKDEIRDRHPLPKQPLSYALRDRSLCAPTMREFALEAKWSDEARMLEQKFASMRFYLHNEGAFNFSTVTSCYRKLNGLRSTVDDWDDHVQANIAEHLTDLWLIRALERHPQRTMNKEEADLHILAVPFFASYQAALTGCGSMSGHDGRIKNVTNALVKLPEFQRSQGRDFFVFATQYSLSKIFTEPMLNLLGQGNIIVGTADKYYMQWAQHPSIKRLVILPYKVHYAVERDALQENKLAYDRSLNFMFRGSIGRRHEGRQRGTLSSLASLLQNADVRNVSFKNFPPTFTRETADSYTRTKFCLTPAGDTPTSRRLYDAMAAGCVPVVLGRFDILMANLPFRHTIDWTQILLFGGSLPCVHGDLQTTARWLQGLAHDSEPGLEERMRAAGREVFREALSYTHGNGLVTALMKELAHQLQHPPAYV